MKPSGIILTSTVIYVNVYQTILQIETPDSEVIHFLRCKGGAFYAYSQSEKPLLKLRSLWTITVQQLFPSLEFTDALVQIHSMKVWKDHTNV